jgi:hypothetical protein
MLRGNVRSADPFSKDVPDKLRFFVYQRVDLTKHIGAIKSGDDRGDAFQLEPIAPFVVSIQGSRNPW